MNIKTSVIILTNNEQDNIGKCMSSVAWSDEIIIIDDYSNDKTTQIAQSRGAKVFKRRLNNDFSSQRNFGLKKAKNNWVLFLDADEILTAFLSEEIVRRLKNINPGVSGFCFKRTDHFINQWLKHGETSNVRLLRLAKKNSGSWIGKVHETWQIKGETEEFSNPILHHPHKNLTSLYEKINFYTGIRAKELSNKGVKSTLFQIVVYPVGKFIQNYVLRKGFRDGTAGMVFAISMSFHSFLVRVKLWQKN